MLAAKSDIHEASRSVLNRKGKETIVLLWLTLGIIVVGEGATPHVGNELLIH
jgi:hypothetical protein